MLLDFINALAFFTFFFTFVGFGGWFAYILIDAVYDWVVDKLRRDDE